MSLVCGTLAACCTSVACKPKLYNLLPCSMLQPVLLANLPFYSLYRSCPDASHLNPADRPRTTLRSSLVASDFTLPRSRRRPASPGPRSELARPGRRVRRRLVRNGQQPYATSQRQASDAEMILNALERSISARDHSGQSTSCEHRWLTHATLCVIAQKCMHCVLLFGTNATYICHGALAVWHVHL